MQMRNGWTPIKERWLHHSRKNKSCFPPYGLASSLLSCPGPMEARHLLGFLGFAPQLKARPLSTSDRHLAPPHHQYKPRQPMPLP